MAEQSAYVDLSGHVERTNDRDYEVEERLGCLAVNPNRHFRLSTA